MKRLVFEYDQFSLLLFQGRLIALCISYFAVKTAQPSRSDLYPWSEPHYQKKDAVKTWKYSQNSYLIPARKADVMFGRIPDLEHLSL